MRQKRPSSPTPSECVEELAVWSREAAAEAKRLEPIRAELADAIDEGERSLSRRAAIQGLVALYFGAVATVVGVFSPLWALLPFLVSVGLGTVASAKLIIWLGDGPNSKKRLKEALKEVEESQAHWNAEADAVERLEILMHGELSRSSELADQPTMSEGSHKRLLLGPQKPAKPTKSTKKK